MSNDEIMVQQQELTSYSPQGLISQALAQGLPVSTLERLMDLSDRWEKAQAKKAFDLAMSVFQGKCPVIRKTKKGAKTKAGFVAYKYAPIENIVEQTKSLIAECGFSYLIKTPSFNDGVVEVSCEVRHIAGHSETSIIKMPLLGKTEMMSEAQVVAGTSTFAKRYAFCNAFGIMTMDEDTDGQKPVEQNKNEIPAPPNAEKVKEIKKCLTIKDLNKLWTTLTEAEHATYKNTFSSVRSLIEDANKKEKA